MEGGEAPVSCRVEVTPSCSLSVIDVTSSCSTSHDLSSCEVTHECVAASYSVDYTSSGGVTLDEKEVSGVTHVVNSLGCSSLSSAPTSGLIAVVDRGGKFYYENMCYMLYFPIRSLF